VNCEHLQERLNAYLDGELMPEAVVHGVHLGHVGLVVLGHRVSAAVVGLGSDASPLTSTAQQISRNGDPDDASGALEPGLPRDPPETARLEVAEGGRDLRP